MFYAIGVSAKNISRGADGTANRCRSSKAGAAGLHALAAGGSGVDLTSLGSAVGSAVENYARPNNTGAFTDSANIDYAIVQRVRSGVVIGTYYFNFNGASCTFGTETAPEAVGSSRRKSRS